MTQKEKDELIAEMCRKMSEKDNTMDLNAYARGLEDMFIAALGVYLKERPWPPVFGLHHPVNHVPAGMYTKDQMYQSFLLGWDSHGESDDNNQACNDWVKWMKGGADD